MIKFTKDSSGVYVAEFQVTDDFNLHIEREQSGYLIVNQRTTAEGKYDSIRDGSFNYGDPVVDIDFTGVIYPKYIQVISKVEPTYAEVTSNGEGKQMGASTFTVRVYTNDGEIVYTYYYDEGMTWREWVFGDNNVHGFFVEDVVYGVDPDSQLNQPLETMTGGVILPNANIEGIEYSLDVREG